MNKKVSKCCSFQTKNIENERVNNGIDVIAVSKKEYTLI